MATRRRLVTGICVLVALTAGSCARTNENSARGSTTTATPRPSDPWHDDIQPAPQQSLAACGPLRLGIPQGWELTAPARISDSVRGICELRMSDAPHGVPVLDVVAPGSASVGPADLLATALSQLGGPRALRRTTDAGGREADWDAVTQEADHTHYRALAVDHEGTYLLLLTALEGDYLTALPGYLRVSLDLS